MGEEPQVRAGTEAYRHVQEFNALWESGEAAPVHPALDPEAAFLRALAAIRKKFPAHAESLCRLAFCGVEEAIRLALDSLSHDAIETFHLRRDKVLASLGSLVGMFDAFSASRIGKWRSLCEVVADEFDRGEAAYKIVQNRRTGEAHRKKFSADPEQRFYEVVHWARMHLRNALHSHHMAGRERTREPEELLLAGIQVIVQSMHDHDFLRKSEAERQVHYAELARMLWRAIAAFMVLDTLQTR